MGFLKGAFEAPDPYQGGGAQIRAEELLDRETARVDAEFEDRPELRGHFLNTLAIVYQNLGLFEKARFNFDGALAARRASDESGGEVAESLVGLAGLMIQEGAYEDALQHVDEAVAILDANGETESGLRADAIERRALATMGLGRFEVAASAHRRALDMRRSLYGDQDKRVATSWRHLAESVGYLGRPAEALEMAERAIAIFTATRGEASIECAEALFVRGDQYYQQRILDKAIEDYDRALTIYRSRVAAMHPSVGILLNNRARALRLAGRLAESEADYRHALEIIRRTLGDEHREVATILSNISQVLRARGRYDDAMSFVREANERLLATLGRDHPIYGAGLNIESSTLAAAGWAAAAEPLALEARRIHDAAFEPGHPRTSLVLANLARIRIEQTRFDDAEALLRDVLVDQRAGGSASVIARALIDLGELEVARGRAGAAEDWFRQALVSLPEGARLDRATVKRRLAESLILQSRCEEAAHEASAALDALGPAEHAVAWQQAQGQIVLAAAGSCAGDATHSAAEVESAAETVRLDLGDTSAATRDALVWAAFFFEQIGDRDAAARWRAALDRLRRARAARRIEPDFLG